MSKEPRQTSVRRCEHCGNRAPAKVVAHYHQPDNVPGDKGEPPMFEQGDAYELVECPACSGVTLRHYFWNENVESEGDLKITVLYPSDTNIPVGLPGTIQREYEAALLVRSHSANAYGVLLGRVLEYVCEDRKAAGDTLHRKLQDLATKGEIPQNLVGVANGLKNLRNVGAHAVLGALSPAEVPVLDSLCKAILEYVYSAPHLAAKASEALEAIKKRRQPRKSR